MPGTETALDSALLATPSRVPLANRELLYPKADGKWYALDANGAEKLLSQAATMLAPVRASSTFNNVSSPSGTMTLDGVALNVGDRVLLRGQTGGTGNGIWIVQTAAWTRAPDANTAAKIQRGTQVFVLEGNQDRGKVFTQYAVVTTIDTDANNWRVVTFVDLGGSLQGPFQQGTGHVWWDTNNACLQGWNGTAWAKINGLSSHASSGRPGFIGSERLIYETDTKNAMMYNGSAWVPFGAITTLDESASPQVVSALDFQGPGVTMTPGAAGTAVVTVASGGGTGVTCRVATTGDIASFTAAPSVVDGITLSLNDRVLVRLQNTLSQNGVYAVTTVGTGSNGVWVRATEADAASELAALECGVQSGTQFGGTRWYTTFKSTDTVGSTSMLWLQQGSSMTFAGRTIPAAGGIVTFANASSNNVLNPITDNAVPGGTNLIFAKYTLMARCTTNQQVTYYLEVSVDGGTTWTQIDQMTQHNNGDQYLNLGGAVAGWFTCPTGTTSIRYRVTVNVGGGGGSLVIGQSNMEASYFSSGPVSTPDSIEWRSVQAQSNTHFDTTALQIPFNANSMGNGITINGSGQMVINKAGVYEHNVNISANQYAGAATESNWIICGLRQWRSGSVLSTREVVLNIYGGGWDVGGPMAIYDCLAGDIFDVICTAAVAGRMQVDPRSNWTCHRVGAPAVSPTPVVAAGFRGNAQQTITSATLTALTLDTTDHNLGGVFSVSGSVITINTAGVYQFSAGMQSTAVGATGRCFFRVETWTGTAPAVGSGACLAEQEAYYTNGFYCGFSVSGQAYLAAGAQLRCYVYQGSGGNILTWGAQQPVKFNLEAIALASAPPVGLIAGYAPLSLLNSWAVTSGRTPGYCKDANGFVHLRGTMSGGASGSQPFVVPPGFRPGLFGSYPAAAATVFSGQLNIDVNGATALYFASGGSICSLDGITFLAEN